jgi:hypothetical protein
VERDERSEIRTQRSERGPRMERGRNTDSSVFRSCFNGFFRDWCPRVLGGAAPGRKRFLCTFYAFLFFLCQVLCFQGNYGYVPTRRVGAFSIVSKKRCAHTIVWGSVEEIIIVRPFEWSRAVARLDNSNLLPETSCREASVELAL